MDLFPALPEELGRECLVRVPYTSQNNLAAVCRSWEAKVKNPQFYQDRKNLGVSLQFICLIELRLHRDYNKLECVITVYDPQQGTWETLPRLPHLLGYDHEIPLFGYDHEIPLACRCVCVNRKLLLIGGSNPYIREILHTVFIYMISFPLVGAAGQTCRRPLESLSLAPSPRKDSFTLPEVGSSDGRFYWFHKEQGVMEYDSKENVWRAASSLPLPETLGTITYCAEWRDMIFVSCYAHEGIGSDIVFYMLKPPPKECAAVTQEKFLGEWAAVPILRPQHSHGDYEKTVNIVSAVTIEI